MKKITFLLLLPLFAAGQIVPVLQPASSAEPVITFANATGTSVEFFWNAVTDAAVYSVSYETDSGMNASRISTGKETRYPLCGLSQGTSIRFTVTPFDGAGNALKSGSAQYTVMGGGVCSSSVVPPAVLNGINITATSSGSVGTYPVAYTSCGTVTTPANSLWLGLNGTFSYTMTFSQPVNNLVIALTATGNTADEIFNFDTNGGIPSIATTTSCFTTVAGNQIVSGNNSGSTGGGGIFTIIAPGNFTTLTITGPGDIAGSLLSVCSNSVTPVVCNVSFAPSLSAVSLVATCPNATVNLDTLTPSNLPTADGVFMTWHTAIPVSQSNQLPGSLDSQPAGPTYYAAFYDSINNCYSLPTAVTTSIAFVTPAFIQIPPSCAGQISSSPLPATSSNGITGTWSPAWNPNVTTTYTFTPEDASCASGASMTVQVTPIANPVFDSVGPVCAGDIVSALPTVSNNSVTGSWSPPINNMATTTYLFTPDPGQCATAATLEIQVNPVPEIAISADCVGQDYKLSAVTDSESPVFEWHDGNGLQIGSGESVVINSPGTYSVIVNANNCQNNADIVVTSVGCEIQKGISPNGDNLNDFFDLTNFDVRNLKIFNRYGILVYSQSHYTNQWKGKSDNGNELPDATYYYLIELVDGQTKTGWIYINTKS